MTNGRGLKPVVLVASIVPLVGGHFLPQFAIHANLANVTMPLMHW